MKGQVIRHSLSIAVIVSLVWMMTGCMTSASSQYFGTTTAPSENMLRYVSGGEPESLDPAVSNSQPDARIYMSMYDALIEYEPKTMDAIPSVAKSWEIGEEGTEYVFHLRDNAKFSNGAPITSHDFVFTMRRGFSPELASRNASLGYYIKYSEAYNAGKVFVKCGDKFLLKGGGLSDGIPPADIHAFLDAPERLTIAGDEAGRTKAFDADKKLKDAAAGCEFVSVKAEDIGVQAVDDHTVRIKLYQPAPYFIGLHGHQFFRIVS
ncbi:MAG: ABC transporter substrate-binding protein, partial [bacterium]|nr:ABC transporter substrate-binding protein [bacterium]